MKFMPRIFRAAPGEGNGGMPGSVVADSFVRPLNRKEAIASGEDIAPVTREEYYLKGLAEGQGGGGLDYVIPEQTVTVTTDAPGEITNVSLDNVSIGDNIVLYLTSSSLTASYIGMVGNVIEGDKFFNIPTPAFKSVVDIIIEKYENKWLFEIMDQSNNSLIADTYTISAIRGF